MMDESQEIPSLQPIIKLNRDMITALLRDHPGGVTSNEARFLVDTYYTLQKTRIRTNNQVKALDRDAKKEDREAEPHSALDRFKSDSTILEENVKKTLAIYVEQHAMAWFFAQTLGVGPVLAAGLLAHIDISKCPTAGHIYRFAGLDPTQQWDKGQRRPWNAQLKTICWKIGDSFVKLSGRSDSFYSRLYKGRKAEEWSKNIAGGFRDVAAAEMEKKKYGKSTEQYHWYTGGCDPSKVAELLTEGETLSAAKCKAEDAKGVPMLSPGHIDSRARRWTVKLFLSHLHECWYTHYFGKPPPAPYPMSQLGHAHYIAPPQKCFHETADDPMPSPEIIQSAIDALYSIYGVDSQAGGENQAP